MNHIIHIKSTSLSRVFYENIWRSRYHYSLLFGWLKMPRGVLEINVKSNNQEQLGYIETRAEKKN